MHKVLPIKPKPLMFHKQSSHLMQIYPNNTQNFEKEHIEKKEQQSSNLQV